MRMRQISEKVPNLEDLVQKLLLVQGAGAYHLSAPLHCNTAKLPLTLVSGSSFLLGQFTAPQAPAARAASHGGRLRGHVGGRKRARAQYPPGTDPAPDSLQNRHPPARRSGQPDARSCAAQRRAHAACRPLLSGLSPLPELENRLDCQNSRAGDFYAIFWDVRPLRKPRKLSTPCRGGRLCPPFGSTNSPMDFTFRWIFRRRTGPSAPTEYMHVPGYFYAS